jgi:hypothetical protein
VKRVPSHAVFSLFASLLLGAPAGQGADDEASPPSVSLLDTGAPATEPLPIAKLKSKSGWKPVPEDNVSHLFLGDAVVLNDRLTVVLRRRGGGAEVYSQTSKGLKQCVTLGPLTRFGGAAVSLGRLEILENSPAAVLLAASFKTADGGDCSLKYRLTAGQTILELQPGVGTDRLLVRGESRYAVIPDFFGEDMVFPAAALTRPRLRLPTENFFLSLLDQGRTQLMCVWQSSQQGAVAIRSAPRQPMAIAGYEIQAAQGKTIWVAVLAGQQLWHEQTVSAEDAKAELALAWKPPFPAKWRADLLNSDGPARCWYFRNKEDPSETPDPTNKTSGPCCFVGDRAVLRLTGEGVAGPAWRYPSSLLVYALDRSRTTPLDTYCPIDVLRNTLGVGPCQYILQTEGLASESNPTPDNVMTWVEKQFQRKKEKKAREEIQEMLGQMAEHVQHAQARIDRYAALALEIRAICRDADPGQQTVAKPLLPLADRLEQAAAAAASGKPAAPPRVGGLAEAIGALIGKDNALADCQRLGAEVRAIGAVQDRALSNCRMTVRWLKQSAAMIIEDNASGSELAKQVLMRAEQGLQTK